MSVRCSLVAVEERPGAYVYQCLLCRKHYRSKYSNPRLVHVVCAPKLKRRKQVEATAPDWGPGTELHELFEALGIKPKASCACEARRRQMDLWGIEGCQLNRQSILDWLKESYAESTWGEAIAAGFWSVLQGTPKSLEGLFDEALRRAEHKRDHYPEYLLEDIQKPPRPRAEGWNTRPAIIEAHQKLLDQAVAANYQMPQGFRGRGIVTLGGGKYLASAYVLCYVLRKLGCQLPIEVWYLPLEMGQTEVTLFEKLGATCIPLAKKLKEEGREPRRMGGWEAKVWAIMYSQFREVLFLDADVVPTRDPSYLFDQNEAGAIFWEDNLPYGWTITERAFKLARLSVPGNSQNWRSPSDYRPFESGQMLIDKSRHWKALEVTAHLCDHSDFWFPQEHRGSSAFNAYVYGDKDLPYLAWERLRAPYRMTPACYYAGDKNSAGAFMQPDFDGQTIFQHRVHPGRKWSLDRENLSIPGFQHHELCLEALADLRKWYGRKIWFDGANAQPITLYPGGQTSTEGLSWQPREGGVLALGEQLFGRDNYGNWCNHGTDNFLMEAPPEDFDLPLERSEVVIWHEIVLDNEYRLPERFELGDVVLDIGGHCGIFAHLCLSRGAKVISVEPHPENYARMEKNLAKFKDRSVRIKAAAIDRCGEIHLAQPQWAKHTGGWTCVNVPEGVTARALDFNSLAQEPLRLVKLDCEGSEWCILESCTQWDLIQAWCGEYHLLEHEAAEKRLRELLEPHGYEVTIQPAGVPRLGHFWAVRN
jgi:FkbM family methyltransferase